MNLTNIARRHFKSGLVGLSVLVLVTAPALAANLQEVNTTADQWMVAQATSQQRVDTLAEERRNLADEYRSTLRESEGLRLYIRQLQAQIKSQYQEMDVVRQESHDIERTNVEILPLMQHMLARLGQFVELDMPFLLEDRRERFAKLNALMPRADVTVSEKYRRIVEAYQLEMEYGRTIEAYRGMLDGKAVDFLRVGRIALLYQTPDGDLTGYWDAQQKKFVEDDDYRHAVREGLLIARKQTSPNLLIVPVLATEEFAAKGSK